MHFFHVLSISRLFQLSPLRFIIIAFRVKRDKQSLRFTNIKEKSYIMIEEISWKRREVALINCLDRETYAWFLILIWLTVSIKPAAIYDGILDAQTQAYGRFIIMTSNMQVYAFNPYSLSFFFFFFLLFIPKNDTFLTYSLPNCHNFIFE